MKLKALRKKDTKEFVDIQGDTETNQLLMFTCEKPIALADTATIEAFTQYYNDYLKPKYPDADINLDNLEVIEYDLFESGEIGADVRDKLSPCKNLVSLLEAFFTEPFEPWDDNSRHKQYEMIRIIKKEMDQSKKSVDYLSKLL